MYSNHLIYKQQSSFHVTIKNISCLFLEMLARLVKMPKTSAKSTRTKAKSKRKATADPAETASKVPVVDIKETMMSEMRDVGYG